LSSLLAALTLPAGVPEFKELLRLYDYDPKAPLDVKEIGVKDRNGIAVHDISYASPKGGRVTAYLLVPPGPGPFAGIVIQHGGSGDRSTFMPMGVMLAKAKAVCLLIDAPLSGERGIAGSAWPTSPNPSALGMP